jgi:hypothetical protein
LIAGLQLVTRGTARIALGDSSGMVGKRGGELRA